MELRDRDILQLLKPEATLEPTPQTDPRNAGLSTSEGKLHALLVMVGSLLALAMPVLELLHATRPGSPWISFAVTVAGALLALFSANKWTNARTALKQSMLETGAYDPTKSSTGGS